MSARLSTLPEGRPGQALALGLVLIVLAVLWLGVAAPITGWFTARADSLTTARQELARLTALRANLPALREQAAAAARQADGQDILLAGGSDAIAGAALQSTLQSLAAQDHASFDSVSVLAPQSQASLRRIGVQVSLTATWPVLIALLAAIDTAHPRMIVDQLTVTKPDQDDEGADVPMEAGFTVSAFRAGAP